MTADGADAGREADWDPDDATPVEIPITPELDLHTFRPSDLGSLIPDYLAACRVQGISPVRVVHGKGTGTLRTTVHALLARVDFVQSIEWPAGPASGGWGATWVYLKPESR